MTLVPTRSQPAEAFPASPWVRVPLSEVCFIDAPIVDPRQSQYRDLPHINGENIETGTGRLLPFKTAAQDGVTSGKYLFEQGAVLYSKLRPYLRKVAVVDFRGLCSADMYPLVFDVNRVHVGFAKFVLLSETFTSFVVEASARARMPKVNREQLMAFPFPLPSRDEQEHIAKQMTEQLSEVDRARRAAQDRLTAAEALPAAYLRDLFEGVGTGEYQVLALGDVVKGTGQYGTSRRSNSTGRGLPVLGMPHIHGGRIRWENVSCVDLEPADLAKYRLVRDDVLFNRTNSAELVGKTAVFDGGRDAVFASYLIRYRVRSDMADPRFVSAYINSRKGRAYIERHMARAVGQVNISASTMHQMPIPCPPVQRQRQLMDSHEQRLSDGVLPLIARCGEELAALDALPDALLREALTPAD